MLDGRPPKKTQLICNDLRVVVSGLRGREYLGPVLAFPLAVARHQMQRFFGAYSFGFLPTKDQVVLPKHSIEKHGNLALVPCT